MTQPTNPSDVTRRDERKSSPFANENEVIYDRAAQDDDISLVQVQANAASWVSGEHIAHLTYDHEERYIWDAHSSPGGVEHDPR
jgi:hypothetical protein